MTQGTLFACASLIAMTFSACDSDEPTSRCSGGSCPVLDLADSHYCPDGSCIALESLSHGCTGSHTEQGCTACGREFIRVGGDDAAALYFNPDGTLAAVLRVGEGSGSCEAWFGLDLSECAPRGEVRTVYCDTVEEAK